MYIVSLDTTALQLGVLSTNQRVVRVPHLQTAPTGGPQAPPSLKCNKVTLCATRWRPHSVQCWCWGNNDTHIEATGVHYDWPIYEC